MPLPHFIDIDMRFPHRSIIGNLGVRHPRHPVDPLRPHEFATRYQVSPATIRPTGSRTRPSARLRSSVRDTKTPILDLDSLHRIQRIKPRRWAQESFRLQHDSPTRLGNLPGMHLRQGCLDLSFRPRRRRRIDTSSTGQQRNRLRQGQPRKLQAIVLHQCEAPASAANRVQRHPRHRQGIAIAEDRPLRYIQFGGSRAAVCALPWNSAASEWTPPVPHAPDEHSR